MFLDFEVLPMACEEKNPCALAFLTFVNVAFIVSIIKHYQITHHGHPKQDLMFLLLWHKGQ